MITLPLTILFIEWVGKNCQYSYVIYLHVIVLRLLNMSYHIVLQRHFSVFSINFPNMDALQTIYTSILSQHLDINGFPTPVQKYSTLLVNGALALHTRVSSTFLPTAIKFHYVFNLRDLSNIFQVSQIFNLL